MKQDLKFLDIINYIYSNNLFVSEQYVHLSLEEIKRNFFIKIVEKSINKDYNSLSSILLENLLYDHTINLQDKVNQLLSVQKIISDILYQLQKNPAQIDSQYIVIDNNEDICAEIFEECCKFDLYD